MNDLIKAAEAIPSGEPLDLSQPASKPGPCFTNEEWATRLLNIPVSTTVERYAILDRLRRDAEVRQQMAAGISLLNSYSPIYSVPVLNSYSPTYSVPALKALSDKAAKELDRLGRASAQYPVREDPNTFRPMVDWEKLAGFYAAALAEANTKVRLLEDEVARLTPPAPQPERTNSDILACCVKLDKPLDAYGR